MGIEEDRTQCYQDYSINLQNRDPLAEQKLNACIQKAVNKAKGNVESVALIEDIERKMNQEDPVDQAADLVIAAGNAALAMFTLLMVPKTIDASAKVAGMILKEGAPGEFT